ncbi:hypothetical protein BDC45DRAFT_498832 [Circinella umbellata]|nr:hypothetical protein BDC45DRAFT_498832 [Circinella umbellata]
MSFGGPTCTSHCIKESHLRIHFMIHEYKLEIETRATQPALNDKPKLETKVQCLKFLNELYLPVNTMLDDFLSVTYVQEHIRLLDVFGNMVKRSNYVSKMTFNAFASFCGKNGVAFVKQEKTNSNRKREHGSSTRSWMVILWLNIFKINW